MRLMMWRACGGARPLLEGGHLIVAHARGAPVVAVQVEFESKSCMRFIMS